MRLKQPQNYHLDWQAGEETHLEKYSSVLREA